MVTLRSKKADNAKDQGQKAEEQPSESRDEEAIEEAKEDVVDKPSDAKEELLGAKEKPPDTKANPSNTEEDPSDSTEESSNAKEELSETNEEPSGAISELPGAKAEPSDKKEELSDANEEMSDANEEMSDANEELSNANEEVSDANEEMSGAKAEPSDKKEELSDANEEASDAKGDPELKADEQVVEENKEDDEKVEEKEDKEETEERTEIEEEAGNEKENEKEDVTEKEGEIETKTEKEIVKESKIDTEKKMETETEMNKEPEPKEKETETSKDTEMEMETEIDKEKETGIFGEPEEMDKGDKKEVEAETEMAKEMETDIDKEQEAIDKGKETGIESEISKEKETETEIYKQPEAIDKEKVTENYKDNETKDKDKEMETKIAKETETEIDQEMETEIYKKAEAIDKSKESKGKKKKKKKRKNRNRNQVEEKEKSSATVIDDGPEIEYVPEDISIPVGDPSYAPFTKIFEAFRLAETITAKDIKQEAKAEKVEVKKIEERDPIFEEEEVDRSEDEPRKSKKKLKRESRLTVAQLKQLVHRPDVVEMHDVNAKDPRLLVYLKAYRNTVPVPRHWCFKRKYLQGKRGFVKPPFELPEFIKNTGIMEMRAAMQEKEDAKTMKSKQRAKVRPKLGKIDIDYQKLHDAFFKYQTKPKMTIHGDLYYEGKEFETKLKEKKPGDLSDDLRTALGMPVGPGKHLIPPPWLIAMQRYGPPPSYPSLKIPGLNAGIPEGASFGYHAGGWGKPPVDETGKPLYGDVFGTLPHEAPIIVEDEDIDRTPWGELESDEESEESEEEEEEEEEDRTGLITPGDAGLITPSGMSSIPAGLETPDIIELRKRKEIEDLMEAGNETPSLFTVLAEKKANVGGASMMGSAHVYDMNAASGRKTTGEGVEIALDPSELELDPAAMSAKYDETIKERDMTKGKEDLSDMVAEHAARKKRKKPTDSGKSAKKYKEFKF